VRYYHVWRVRCSPDGKHIAYQWGRSLVCEDLSSKHRWEVAQWGDHDGEAVWSRSGRYVAALREKGSAELVLFDALKNEVSSTKLGVRGGDVDILGWSAPRESLSMRVVRNGSLFAEVWRIEPTGRGKPAVRLR